MRLTEVYQLAMVCSLKPIWQTYAQNKCSQWHAVLLQELCQQRTFHEKRICGSLRIVVTNVIPNV